MVTVMTSPYLKLVVGLKTTVEDPPPEKLPAIIPVFFPIITIFVALIVELFVAALKFNVIFESKDIPFEIAVGLFEVKVKD
jgi:hypothetical protein